VWRNFRIAGIELALVHRIVIPRLVLVGNEVNALAALLVAVGHSLELQSRPNRRVLRGASKLREPGQRSYGKRRHPNLHHFPTRMFSLIVHKISTPFDRKNISLRKFPPLECGDRLLEQLRVSVNAAI
jgi:hypothetical protein